jgi:NADPH2:quinone reductase
VRALVCHRFGPVGDLTVEELDSPTPGEGQVVVRVEAAGLNYPDALVVQGKYQVKPPLPFVPGMEVAGTVAAVGPGVEAWRVGDAVMATSQTGAFAEACAVQVERVMRRPGSIPPDVAAASLITYGTTYHALKDRARLRPGETVLVLGAAGGVGTAAVELAKLMGARVIAAASSQAKLAVCRSLGADAVIDYATEPLRERLQELTGGKGGRGVDVVYDPVGGAHAEVALRATGWDGRYLVIGFAAGEIPKVALNLALLNARSILGVYWGDWARRHPAESQENFTALAGWLAAGRLRPVISERLPLAEVPRAMLDLVERRAHGKLVVVP